MITLTTEQAQQIEEALEDIVRVFKFETGTPVEALAAIRAAKAQEQAEQDPVAFVSDVYQSRYTLEWNGRSLPIGTSLYDHSLSLAVRQELEHKAEEAECVKLSLDKAGVPTADASGNVYSLWGRVCRYVEQAEQEPVAWINEDELPEFYPYDDMYQSSKVINGVRMFPNVKVSDRSMFYALTKDHTWISVTETQFNKLKPGCRMKCYAAPVQQVDLTDDEIERALDAAKVPELPDGYKSVDLEIARAVIAADREKNK